MSKPFPLVDFQAIFEACPDSYIVLLADASVFTIVAVSDSYLRATMTTREQILGHSMFKIFPSNPMDMGDTGVVTLNQSLAQVIEEKKTSTLTLQQYDIRRPQLEGGAFEERWWNVINTPVIMDGDVRYIMHQVEDVTEQRKILQEKERLQGERNRIFNATIDIMMQISTEGKILQVNRAWTETLGWQPEEVIGKYWVNYMHPDDLEGTRVTIGEIFNRPTIWEMEQRYLEKNGHYHWLKWRGESYPEENLIYVSAIDITEYKAAEEELRHKVERLNIALEASQFVGTWEWDLINDQVIADPGFARLFSLDPEQAAFGVPSDEYRKALHPNDLPMVEEVASKAIATGNIFDTTYRLIQNDGSIRWIHARGRVQKDENGNPIRFPGVAIDITSEREAIEALKQSEQHWHSLTEAMPQLVWITREGGKCEYLSSQWEHYSGLPVNTLLGYEWLNILHPDDQEPTKEALQAAAEDKAEYNVEFRIRRYDGVYRWFKTRGVPARNEVGMITIWYGTSTDIEDQKQASEDLFEAKERLQLIIESAKDFAIIALCTEGNITSWNLGAERIFGFTAKEVMGKYIALIFTPEDRANHVPEQELTTAKQNGSAMDERWHMRKDGTRFFASGIMTSMYDNKGRLQGITKIARDITDKKYYEEMLIEARNTAEEANQAKSEFLANMSHEIRTPMKMNSIIASTELLLGTSLSQEQQEYTQTIYQGGEILLSLINDILDFSKIEAGEMELHPAPFNVTNLMEEIARIFRPRAKQNDVILILERAEDIPSIILGDTTRLRQVIFNLVGNAVKFTKAGTITVWVIKTSENNNTVTLRFEVKDTGIGIAPDKINTIFEKFVQASGFINKKYGGTGLGLAISKQLTELMGGLSTLPANLEKVHVFG